jgi:hypothetical protein
VTNSSGVSGGGVNARAAIEAEGGTCLGPVLSPQIHKFSQLTY